MKLKTLCKIVVHLLLLATKILDFLVLRHSSYSSSTGNRLSMYADCGSGTFVFNSLRLIARWTPKAESDSGNPIGLIDC